MTICLTSNSRWYENKCALEPPLNKTNFPFSLQKSQFGSFLAILSVFAATFVTFGYIHSPSGKWQMTFGFEKSLEHEIPSAKLIHQREHGGWKTSITVWPRDHRDPRDWLSLSASGAHSLHTRDFLSFPFKSVQVYHVSWCSGHNMVYGWLPYDSCTGQHVAQLYWSACAQLYWSACATV